MTNLDNIPKQSLFNGTLESPVNSVQTAGIVVKPLIDFNPNPGEIYRLSILNPDGAEIIEFEDQNPNGELTGVTRGLELADGVPGVGRAHGAGIRVTLSNPFQLYKDTQTAINSKADILAPTISNLTVTGFIDLPSYANAAARNAAIPAPNANTLVVLEDLNGGNRGFSLFNGVSWVDIDAPTNFPIFTGAVEFPSYADATARNTAIPSPQENQIVVLENLNGGEGGLSYYNGGTWRNIDAPTAAPDFTVRIGVPRYVNNAARDAALPTPSLGQLIFNDTSDTLEIYASSGWQPLDLGTVTPLASTADAGSVRLATPTQVFDGDATGGGQPLTVTPDALQDSIVSSNIPAIGKLAKFGTNNEINVPGGYTQTAIHNITAGSLVSSGYDGTGFEKTFLWHLQDGAKHTVAHGQTNPVPVELNEWEALSLSISSGTIRFKLVSINADIEQTLGSLTDTTVAATSILQAIQIANNKVLVISDNSGTVQFSVIGYDGTTFYYGAAVTITNENITTRNDVDFCSHTSNAFYGVYRGTGGCTDIVGTVGSGASDVTITLGSATVVNAIFLASRKCLCEVLSTTAVALANQQSSSTLFYARRTITGTTTAFDTSTTRVGASPVLDISMRSSSTEAFFQTTQDDSASIPLIGSIIAGWESGGGNFRFTKKPEIFEQNNNYFFSLIGASATTIDILGSGISGGNTPGRGAVNSPTITTSASRQHAVLSQIGLSHGLKIIVCNGANLELWLHYGNLKSVVGVATTTVSAGSTVFAQDKGVVTLAGLTANKTYYQDRNGDFTLSYINALYKLGYALSTTQFYIDLIYQKPTVRGFSPTFAQGAVAPFLLPVSDTWQTVKYELIVGAATGSGNNIQRLISRRGTIDGLGYFSNIGSSATRLGDVSATFNFFNVFDYGFYSTPGSYNGTITASSIYQVI